ESLLAHEGDVVDAGILRAARIKAQIVSRDPTETGERRHLNLGHTLGHALESALGGQASHGACVAMGIRFVARLGATDPAYARQLEDLFAPLCPPPPYPEWSALIPYLIHDKKGVGEGQLRWVVPTQPGDVEVRVMGIDDPHLAETWQTLQGR